MIQGWLVCSIVLNIFLLAAWLIARDERKKYRELCYAFARYVRALRNEVRR